LIVVASPAASANLGRLRRRGAMRTLEGKGRNSVMHEESFGPKTCENGIAQTLAPFE
jgi:hypothetical protein